MHNHRTVLSVLFAVLGVMGLIGMAAVLLIFTIGSAVLGTAAATEPDVPAFLAFLPVGVANIGDRMPEEVGEPNARNGHGPLEGEKHARPSPTVGFHVEHVMGGALGVNQFDRTGGHLVGRVAHDCIAEGALARTVGPHQSMDLAPANRQIDTLEDFPSLDGDMQILDFQAFTH